MLTKQILQMNYGETANNKDFLNFAELMTNHIRFEERVLFPHLEKELPISTLEMVGAYLAQQHQTPFKEDYPDRFWEQ